MAAVEVTITGILYDKVAKTSQNVALIGEAFLTNLSIGGGPIIPPPEEKPPRPPLGIWPGPGDPDFPGKPPTVWPGPGDPDFPGKPPIVIPPPDWQPPEDFVPPPPGSTVPVGPPLLPVHPIVVPDFILVRYPGNGWIAVGKPVPPPA